MLVAGYVGLEDEAMAKGALLAIGGGLLFAIPTTLTGLLDRADLSKGARVRKLATYHLTVMLLATAAFAVTFVLQRPGYLDGEVTLDGLVAGCVALGLLILGGTLGGAPAYVYDVRVVKRDVPVSAALIPGRLEEKPPARTNVSARSSPAAVAATPAPGPAVSTPPAPVASASRWPTTRRASRGKGAARRACRTATALGVSPGRLVAPVRVSMEKTEGAPMPATRPRLEMEGPLLWGNGELHIVGRHEVMTIHDPDGAVHRLLTLADGSRTRPEIYAAMTPDFPRLRPADVDDAVAELEAMGILQDCTPRGRILSSRASLRSGHDRGLLAGSSRAV